MRRPRVVIVGGGFGGLACARRLDGEPVDVLLLDRRNYHLFTPLLYQVATALLNPSDIAFPFRARFRRSPNVRFRQASVETVDFAGATVTLSDGDELPYDRLVLATGSTNDYFGNPELQSATIGMKSLDQALRLRNHVLSCLERAAEESDAEERQRWLTFVIVGGGPTGVEYAGALGELLSLVLGRDYPELAPGSERIVLLEGQDRLLGTFPPRLSRYAERVLRRRGVNVRTGTFLQKASGDSALLSTGDQIGTRTIVWSAGVRPSEPVQRPEPPHSRSRRVEVDGHFRIAGQRNAFAIGDVAAARQGDAELPMLSPVAMQAGRHVADIILDEVRAAPDQPRDRKPFHYVDKGSMATIGRNAAVGRVKGIGFTGFVGWVAWLVVHIYYLIGFRNRLVVLASWGWDYLRRDRPIRIIARGQRDSVADGPPAP
jgi:NADH:ubiquinone reductase (H+-translocating)